MFHIPPGNGRSLTWGKVVGITPVTKFPLRGQQSRCVGQVAPFKAVEVDRRIDFDGLNEISRFAAAAGRLALEDAGLKFAQCR